MTSLFSKLFGRKDAALDDAGLIYKSLMIQARQTGFYGAGRVADTYDGRIDLLTLHIAPVMHRLQSLGPQGKRLSQGIYDVMRDDFEVALREEGMSDTGVKKRIKPIMNLFFTQVKAYAEQLDKGASLTSSFKPSLVENSETKYAIALSEYISGFRSDLEAKSLGQIARAEFVFPQAPT